jgi:predicted SnoaL-like aldol condensation-catalyzing enzyme
MGVAENKALVRRFYEEVWNRGNVEFAHEVVADDYVRHDLRPTEALPGGAGMAKIAADFRRAFPDAHWRVDLVLGEDDFVAARWTATGTFSGDWGTFRRRDSLRPSRASTSFGSAPTGRWPSSGTTGRLRLHGAARGAGLRRSRSDSGSSRELTNALQLKRL